MPAPLLRPRRSRASSPLLLTVLTVLAGLVAASVLLAPARAGAVANGLPVPRGALGFAAKLTFTGIPRTDGTTYDSACSGALVAPEWVVTAGHCFHDAARTPVGGPPQYATSTVTVGRTSGAGGGESRSVVDVRQAPGGADVALARLSAPVTTVRPLGLTGEAPRVGQVLALAGWGATSADGPPSTQLLTGLVRVSSVGDPLLGVTGYAPAPDTSACPYDSGAPYFRISGQGLVLVSVESGGPSCPHADPERTTRTDVLVPWISGQVA